jgi:hypothetical protein
LLIPKIKNNTLLAYATLTKAQITNIGTPPIPNTDRLLKSQTDAYPAAIPGIWNIVGSDIDIYKGTI